MKNYLFLGIISIMSVGCSKEHLSGNGRQATETRSPGKFNKISSSGSNEIHISYGAEPSIELKGSSNLLPYFETRVSGNTVYLGYDDKNIEDDDVKVYITIPSVEGVRMSGSGKVEIKGRFAAVEDFKFESSGSGEINVGDEFNADHLNIDISGSANAELQKIKSRWADISISGSGDVFISADEKIKARISGSGKIYYNGSPQIDSKVSGSGKLIKL